MSADQWPRYLVYAVAGLIVLSVLLFAKASFIGHRRQKIGLLLGLLSVPLYMIYYQDLGVFQRFPMRQLISPLDRLHYLTNANSKFVSSVAPAVIVGGLLLLRLTVVRRAVARKPAQPWQDPVANIFGLIPAATLVGAILVSTFAWGWVGAVSVTAVFTLVYLGALALIAAMLEVGIDLWRLVFHWLRRRYLWLSGFVVGVFVRLAMLHGQLRPKFLLDRLEDKIRAEMELFDADQVKQDVQLLGIYIGHLERHRALLLRRHAGPAPDSTSSSRAGPGQTGA